MSDSVVQQTRVLRVTEGNLRNSHLYIPGTFDFFPADSLGGSKRKDNGAGTGVPIRIHLDGLNKTAETDICSQATGKPRRMFRARSWVGEFFRFHGTQAGDELALERISARQYRLYPVAGPNGSLPTNGNHGSSLELFVGAGGLALGTARAGFEHRLLMDWDADACETLRRNKRAGVEALKKCEVVECDARKFQFKPLSGQIDFVFGGPPCQPFSLGGKHLGHRDERNMFPVAIRAIRDLQPRAFIFENVKGLLRTGFADYYDYVIRQLELPELGPKPNESWQDHKVRLEKASRVLISKGLRYTVQYRMLNAANYGVPQRRERVFIVGVRSDLEQSDRFQYPDATHSEDRLLSDKWITGEYWDRHRIPRSKRPALPPSLRSRVERLRLLTDEVLGKPWQTVRDAISDLPTLSAGQTSRKVLNHFLNPGARSYFGHNGSPYDEPAKTLKAGDHGVPGGENMLRLESGEVRYFSVRECARIQSFPDDWELHGSWTESMRQLGNAVPVRLGEAVARSLANTIGRIERPGS